MSMGRHQRSVMKSDTWLTPRYIIESLGEFDLDPCTPEQMPWPTANKRYTKKDDGLKKEWHGRVWLNPPYSKEAIKWLEKMAKHQNGIALVFARTETNWFFRNIWDEAAALLFLKGRVTFCNEKGEKAPFNSGAPSVLCAFGEENLIALKNCNLEGKFVDLRKCVVA